MNCLARLIKISDGQMSELGVAPEPVKQIYNDAKTYEFKRFCVRISSPFIMECKEILGGAAINGEVKYENLNANVLRKEQSIRIGKPSGAIRTIFLRKKKGGGGALLWHG